VVGRLHHSLPGFSLLQSFGCGSWMHDVVMFVEDVRTIPTHHHQRPTDLRPNQSPPDIRSIPTVALPSSGRNQHQPFLPRSPPSSTAKAAVQAAAGITSSLLARYTEAAPASVSHQFPSISTHARALVAAAKRDVRLLRKMDRAL
jgi:hypothetical protein